MQQIPQHIEQLQPVYIIVGTDEVKAQQAKSAFKSLIPTDQQTFNFSELDLEADADIDEVVAQCNTIPLGALKRLVLVEHVSISSKHDTDTLKAYVSDPSPDTSVLLCAEKIDKRSSMFKFLKDAPHAVIIDCTAATRKDVLPRVFELARMHKVVIDQDAARELIERVGENTRMLEAQLKSLSAQGQGTITRALVERSVVRLQDIKFWDLQDAVCEKNCTRALKLYAQAQGNEVYLVMRLAERMRELACTAHYLTYHDRAGAAQALKKKPFVINIYAQYLQRFSEHEIEQALAALAEADMRLKSSYDNQQVMVHLLARLCQVR